MVVLNAIVFGLIGVYKGFDVAMFCYVISTVPYYQVYLMIKHDKR